MSGIKNDHDKPRYDLIPVDALDEITRVLSYGAKKYGDRNWEKGLAYSRVYRALLGHIWAWWSRNGPDEETGLSHLAHAGCCILFLLSYEVRGMTEFDDRAEKLTNK